MSRYGALAIVASGPGVGSHTATCFAQHGFRMLVLMSRDVGRLAVDAMIIKSVVPNTTIHTISVDLANPSTVASAFDEAHRRLDGTPIECIIFNAAGRDTNVLRSVPTEKMPHQLQVRFADSLDILPASYRDAPLRLFKSLHTQMSTTSFHTLVQQELPNLFHLAQKDQGYRPTLLVICDVSCQSASLHTDSLATCKALLVNLLAKCSAQHAHDRVTCGMVDLQRSTDSDDLVRGAQVAAKKAWASYDCQRE